MRLLPFLRKTSKPRSIGVVLLAASVLGGCVWTSDGGITGRVESDWEAEIASVEGSWDGTPITISSDGGSVQVIGRADLDRIRVRARFVAGANSSEDAEAAFRDMEQQLTIEHSEAGWSITCPEPLETHGSAVPSSTGCASLVVEVPAGSEAAPIDLRAATGFGGIHVSGLHVAHLDLTAPFGLVADVIPTTDATLRMYGQDLVSGLCNTVLRVPETTGFGELTLSVQHPELRYVGVDDEDPEYMLGAEIRGFGDAPFIAPRTGEFSWAREGKPHVARAELRASLGKAVVTTAPIAEYDDFNQCAKLEVY